VKVIKKWQSKKKLLIDNILIMKIIIYFAGKNRSRLREDIF